MTDLSKLKEELRGRLPDARDARLKAGDGTISSLRVTFVPITPEERDALLTALDEAERERERWERLAEEAWKEKDRAYSASLRDNLRSVQTASDLTAARERIATLEKALGDLLPYAKATVPHPRDVGERNVIGRAEDLLAKPEKSNG